MERVVAWEVRKVSEGKDVVSLVMGAEWRSWARTSKSVRERSSMKLIRLCILSFWRREVVGWVLDFVLVFVYVLRFWCLVGFDMIEFWYEGGRNTFCF